MATAKTSSTKPATKPAAKAAKTEDLPLNSAYCMKTKKKEVVDNGIVEKTERGQYILKGTATKEKHKVTAIVSESTAKQLVADKLAKKGW